jgi:transcriptional regulator with XRE-family HTH domain
MLDIKEKKKTIGENIRRYRSFKGWDQAALGAKVDLRKETISRIESGKENVALDTLLKIVDALEVGIEEICLKDMKAVSMRLVLSENNANTLMALLGLIKDILVKKNTTEEK